MAYYGHDKPKLEYGEILLHKRTLDDLLDVMMVTLACVMNGTDHNYLQAKMVMDEMVKIRETLRMKPEKKEKKK